MESSTATTPSHAAVEFTLSEVAYDHLLVPLDGTTSALAALPTAHALAARFGAEVHAVSVAKDSTAVESLLNVGRVAVEAPIGADRVVVVEDVEPAAAIIQRAKELGSCLVVMSAGGRGRVGGALLGSVTRSVLTEVGPVVALGPLADRPVWTPPPASWRPALSVPRIVACVDGSPGSEAVLPVASSWAQRLGMTLSIVMFVEDGPTPLRAPEGAARYGFTHDPSEYLQHLVAQWQAGISDTDALVLREPIGPGSGIRLHLSNRPAGLVAVSTQARSGMRRILGGAAADKIIRSSVAPCLVVHQ